MESIGPNCFLINNNAQLDERDTKKAEEHQKMLQDQVDQLSAPHKKPKDESTNKALHHSERDRENMRSSHPSWYSTNRQHGHLIH